MLNVNEKPVMYKFYAKNLSSFRETNTYAHELKYRFFFFVVYYCLIQMLDFSKIIVSNPNSFLCVVKPGLTAGPLLEGFRGRWRDVGCGTLLRR